MFLRKIGHGMESGSRRGFEAMLVRLRFSRSEDGEDGEL